SWIQRSRSFALGLRAGAHAGERLHSRTGAGAAPASRSRLAYCSGTGAVENAPRRRPQKLRRIGRGRTARASAVRLAGGRKRGGLGGRVPTGGEGLFRPRTAPRRGAALRGTARERVGAWVDDCHPGLADGPHVRRDDARGVEHGGRIRVGASILRMDLDELIGPLLIGFVYLLLALVPLAIVWCGWLWLSSTLNREERARCFLGLLELGLQQGRSPEQTIRSLADARVGLDELGSHFPALAEAVQCGNRLSAALDAVPRFLTRQ